MYIYLTKCIHWMLSFTELHFQLFLAFCISLKKSSLHISNHPVSIITYFLEVVFYGKGILTFTALFIMEIWRLLPFHQSSTQPSRLLFQFTIDVDCYRSFAYPDVELSLYFQTPKIHRSVLYIFHFCKARWNLCLFIMLLRLNHSYIFSFSLFIGSISSCSWNLELELLPCR